MELSDIPTPMRAFDPPTEGSTMAGSGETGRDRISHEIDAEKALGDVIAMTVAEQAMPGIFAGGKEIVRTEAYPDDLTFWFDDGSALRIQGSFSVKYKQSAVSQEAIVPENALIEMTKKGQKAPGMIGPASDEEPS